MTPINGITDQLEKLAKLHADGALSDEEFQSLKQKLIVQKFGSQQNSINVKNFTPEAEREKTKISDLAAWGLALAPVMERVITKVIVPGERTDIDMASISIFYILLGIFLFIDRKIISDAGVKIFKFEWYIIIAFTMSVFGVPLYLYHRSQSLQKSIIIMIVSIITYPMLLILQIILIILNA